jgi:hypothetical protein
MKQLLLLITASWLMVAEGQTVRTYKMNLKPYPSPTIFPQFFSGEYSNGMLTWELDYKSFLHHEIPQGVTYAKYETSFDDNKSYSTIGYRYVKFEFIFYDSLKRVIGDTVKFVFKVELREGKGVADQEGVEKFTMAVPSEPFSGTFAWAFNDMIIKQPKKEKDSVWTPLGVTELKLRRQKKKNR